MEDKEGSFAGHWHRAHGLFGSVPPIVGSDNQRGKFICLIFICFICATEVFGGGTVIMEGRGWFIRPLRLRGRATTAAQ